MVSSASPVPRHHGARVVLRDGQAQLLSQQPTPLGAVAGYFSVLSPGTERRHLAATAFGRAREAGYMNLGRGDDAWMVAPVPHGAAFDPGHPGIVTCPPGTPVAAAALARFQQMALLGLDRLPVGVELDGAVVLGSGPVAVGCALELHRRGARPIHVCTARRKSAIEGVPGTLIEAKSEAAHLVIDAAGDPQRAVGMLAVGGHLGLLGTPEEAATIAAVQAHRQGWTVVGMHELADHRIDRYRDAYTTAAAWLAAKLDSRLIASWCRTVPGHRAPEVFASLAEPERRLPEPVILFDWSPHA